MKKINIVTGHYGSGKTEFAINYAIRLKEAFGTSTICDMDIVNPYFRTNDAVEFLKQKGISVIAPEYAGTNLDLPSLPSDIISVFSENAAPSVLDVGGDDDGAIALGQFYPYLSKEDYEMFLVVNTLRPDTSDVKGILDLAEAIQYTSRCRITSIVNNTNLSYLSSVNDIKDSIDLVNEAGIALGLPVKYISGKAEILSQLPAEFVDRLFPMELFMQLPFDATV